MKDKLKNPEDNFDMSYSFDDNLREVPNNIEQFKKGIELMIQDLDSEKNTVRKANLLSKLGTSLRIAGRLEESEAFLMESIRIFEESGLSENILISKIRLSQTLQFRTKLVPALKLINELESELKKNILFESYRDFIFQHKGKILFDMKRFGEAIKYFESALSVRIVKKDNSLIDSSRKAIEESRKRMNISAE